MISLHDKIYRKISIQGKISLIEPLVIASKEPNIGTRDTHTYMVDIKGTKVPCIPGSSIKGIFRSETEFLVSSLTPKSPLFTICNILNYKSSCGGKNADRLKRALRNDNNNNNNSLIASSLDEYCIACQMFGSPNYRGRIKFFDAYPIENYTKYELGKSTEIAVNRLSGEAKRGALFSLIYISPQSEFNFDLQAYNLTLQQIALLIKIIERINDGFRKIGGFSSKGFGKIRIDLLKCNLGHENHLKQDFWEFPNYQQEKSSETDPTDYTSNIIRKFSTIWSEYVGKVTSK